MTSNTVPNIPVSSEEQPNLRGFSSAKEALQAMGDNFGTLTDFIQSLQSSREELSREVEILRDREQRTSEELTRLRALDEQVQQQMLALSEAERSLAIQREHSSAATNDLTAKTQALLQVKTEYREVLEKLDHASSELDTLRVALADTERKREQFELSAETLQRDLKEKKREVAEFNTKLLEQTAALNESQAKLLDTEETLKRVNEQILIQAQELKESKWDAMQQREELRVTKGELVRKSKLLDEREEELDGRAETIRAQQDQLAGLDSELQRTSHRLAESEQALTRTSSKVSEQAAALTRSDKSLAQAQEELEQKHQALRILEERQRLSDSERTGLEEELSRLREQFKAKSEAFDIQAHRAEDLQRRLGVETQKCSETGKLNERNRSEIAALKEDCARLQSELTDHGKHNLHLTEKLRAGQEEFESLQHEHRNVLRTEAQQAKEYEQTCRNLEKKTEALREMQTQAAELREKLELVTMKFDQQSLSLMEAQRKSAKLQEEVQTYKRQMQRTSRVPELQAEVDDLKRELESRGLRLEQQEQLIRLLQTRVGEKRVVPISGRGEPSAKSRPNQEENERDSVEAAGGSK